MWTGTLGWSGGSLRKIDHLDGPHDGCPEAAPQTSPKGLSDHTHCVTYTLTENTDQIIYCTRINRLILLIAGINKHCMKWMKPVLGFTVITLKTNKVQEAEITIAFRRNPSHAHFILDSQSLFSLETFLFLCRIGHEVAPQGVPLLCNKERQGSLGRNTLFLCVYPIH